MQSSRRPDRGRAAPGRNSSRPGDSRPRRRAGAPAESVPEQKQPLAEAAKSIVFRLPSGLAATRRLFALGAVVIFLILTYAGSVRIYLNQAEATALARQQIVERSAEIDRLTDVLARWQDPDYVRAQARDRLGWVVPGETGYRVIGPDGQVLSGAVAAMGKQQDEPATWYEKAWGSVRTADLPAPAEAAPAEPPIITVPTPTPTKR